MQIPKKKKKKERNADSQMPCLDLRTEDWHLHGSILPRGNWFRADLRQTQIWGDPAPWAGAQGGANLGQDHTPCIPFLRGARQGPHMFSPHFSAGSFDWPAGALRTRLPAQRGSAVGSLDRAGTRCSPGGARLFRECVHITSHLRHRQRAFGFYFYF